MQITLAGRNNAMRTFTVKALDFWDELGAWNQYGITFIGGIAVFVLCLEVATKL